MNKEESIDEIAENTEVYSQLHGEKFGRLVKIVSKSKMADKTFCATDKCKLYVVAPLFLYMRSMFMEGIEYGKDINNTTFDKFVEYSKKFGFEFSVASYLLGLTLGYEKTYDAYYDCIHLNIFKRKEEVPDKVKMYKGRKGKDREEIEVPTNLISAYRKKGYKVEGNQKK